MDQRFVRRMAEAPLGAVGFMDRLHPFIILCRDWYDPGSIYDHRISIAN